MERFWSKVNKTGDCWNWISTAVGDGYGRFKINGKLESAHRVAWMLVNGDIPDGLQVCHTCDNRLCCNPSHLFLGTRSDNMRDCARKGRLGAQNGGGARRKLTKHDVVRIYSLRKSGMSLRKIGEQFDIDHVTVLHIVHGKIWKHIYYECHGRVAEW